MNAAAHITAELVEAEARRLARDRRWYRTTARALFGDRWADLESHNRAALREVLRIRSAAKRAMKAAR